MDASWTWSDLAPARAGGRPLPNHVRLMFVVMSLAAGIGLGDLLRLVIA